jgi:hypothetical protein
MGMTTGLDSASFQNLQLNAGVFLKKFDYSSITTVEALKTAIAEAMENAENRLGATRGGGSFQAVPQTRNIEADGKRYDFVGSTVYDYWDIHMTGTLLETTPGNVRDVLSSADAVTEGKVTKLTLRTQPEEKDYMDLVWIGDTSKGLMLIGLQNALNTAGMNFTFTDKGEGTLPFDFRAHQEKVNDYDTAPVDIIFLEA